jgi:hypothetical protein
MATEEPMADMMFVIRMVPALIFILFMMVIFFSFKVQVRIDDMQRFNMEAADVLTGSALAAHPGIFNPAELNKLQTSTALYARTCEYEYRVEIESVGAKRKCSVNEDCMEYCREIGTAEYNCNFELFSDNFCECRKDAWRTGYYWKIGYSPKRGLLEYNQQEFPVGLSTPGGVMPAKLTITAQDSLLTRLSCITQKSFETKQNITLVVGQSQLRDVQQPYAMYFGRKDDNLCIYADDDALDDCRYMPNVPVDILNLNGVSEIVRNSKVTITAYPLKADTTCGALDGNIAGFGDTVEKILLCAK